MLTYSQVKQCINEFGRRQLEDYISESGEDFIEAVFNCDISLSDIDEAYSGQFSSDVDFVQDLLESTGDIPDLPAYIHIDWESTANDIMMDYSESNGYYFRNL
jgi:antirestriction protein